MSKLTTSFTNELREVTKAVAKTRLELKLVTEYPGNIFSADVTSRLAVNAVGVISSPAWVPTPKEPMEFEWFDEEINGLIVDSTAKFLVPISGAPAKLGIRSLGEFILAIKFTDNISRLGLKSLGSLYVEANKANWIKWSNIGSLDFTIWKDNIAGEHPLDWKGWVYAIKKLRDKIVVYGENGVSLLTPVGPAYGLNTIYRIGLKGKHAVTGDDTKHFFIDRDGKLIKLTDSIDILDYSEYLSTLYSSIVMSYDALNNLVYICDGDKGYVFDVSGNSLGECQGNITGVGYQSGTLYITAPAAIITDPFEICTDIYDFGTRNGKTIHSLEFGTDLTTGLYASIDYRRDKATGFSQTPWYTVWKNGMVPINAYGREFRFRVKTLIYEQFNLDYILINGVQDAY